MAKLPKKTLIDRIDAVTIEPAPREHLGASILGDPCRRKLVYSFRWAFKRQHDARLERIFRLGDDIEEQIIAALASIGIRITDQQRRVTDDTGHAGGSIDGIATNVPGFPDEELLFEAKSMNNQNWNDVVRKGVQDSKPTHYTQVMMYKGRIEHLRFTLYCAYNKDNSKLHIEILPFDEDHFQESKEKENDVINARHIEEFPRLSTNPSWYHCKSCDAKNICHNGARVERNCRTCENFYLEPFTAVCALKDVPLDYDAQVAGCDDYEYGSMWK